MPRAGGVYSAPPGTAGTPNTTIESAKYNALVTDLVADANTARPITAGGTGATSAIGANDGLNVYGADMASAATLNLAAATGVIINVTGTVTITALGTLPAGALRVLVFTGILTLTHNATSLILPTLALAPNLTTAIGDVAMFRSKGSGNWICVSYMRANGGLIKNTLASPVITTPSLTLAQSAAPAPTAEGDIQWDTDDNILLIGDGAAAQTFVPFPAGVVAGDLFYASSAKALIRLPKGTANQALLMNTGATAPNWATLPFTKSFKSTQQAITNAGALTIAHGLGTTPELYGAYVVCVTVEGGYSIGNEVPINPGLSGDISGAWRGVSLVPDATNINVKLAGDANPIAMIRKDTGAPFVLTSANWKLVVKAWA